MGTLTFFSDCYILTTLLSQIGGQKNYFGDKLMRKLMKIKLMKLMKPAEVFAKTFCENRTNKGYLKGMNTILCLQNSKVSNVFRSFSSPEVIFLIFPTYS